MTRRDLFKTLAALPAALLFWRKSEKLSEAEIVRREDEIDLAAIRKHQQETHTIDQNPSYSWNSGSVPLGTVTKAQHRWYMAELKRRRKEATEGMMRAYWGLEETA